LENPKKVHLSDMIIHYTALISTRDILTYPVDSSVL